MNLPVISLFSGAGGLDLGLHKAGFDTRVCVEIEPFCQRTIEINKKKGYWSHDLQVFGDINSVSPQELLRAAKLEPGEAFLVAGGPPCQAFSTAGKRRSVQDPRGSLFFRFAQIIGEIRPRFFIFENVRGILSAAIKHRPLNQRGAGYPPLEPEEELGSLLKHYILPTLRESLGYEVVYGLVNAADYGVPQDRQRVIFIGSRDNELGSTGYRTKRAEMPVTELLVPTHSRSGTGGLPKWRTLGEALRLLVQPELEIIPYSKERAKIFDLVPEGKNWRYIRDNFEADLLQKAMGGALGSSGGRVGFWRRLSFKKVSPTILTSPVQKSTGMCHPVETRPLSVRECARVQQFDDRYEFAGSVSQKYLQVGNAVPVGLGEALGRTLRAVAESLAEEDSKEAV